MDSDCPVCKGEGWVCENHEETAWGNGYGCCDGAGMPCRCNPDAAPDPGMLLLWHLTREVVDGRQEVIPEVIP